MLSSATALSLSPRRRDRSYPGMHCAGSADCAGASTFQADGTWTLDPNTNLENAAPIDAGFTYTITDGDGDPSPQLRVHRAYRSPHVVRNSATMHR